MRFQPFSFIPIRSPLRCFSTHVIYIIIIFDKPLIPLLVLFNPITDLSPDFPVFLRRPVYLI